MTRSSQRSPQGFFVAATAIGVVLALGAVFALGAVLYRMPNQHWSSWGAGLPGALHFARTLLGGEVPQLDEGTFRWLMRGCLAAAWFGYAAAVIAARAGGAPPARVILPAVGLTAALLATLFPPGLSCDVYAYVGFARMPLLHGLNPHAHSQQLLRGLGDPVAPFLQWDLASPYGPLWTVLSMILVAPIRHAPVFAQVLMFKLLAGAALVGLCVVGGRIAERLAPGRGPLAMLAIGLNPLFLVEGPGSGHNDLVLLLPLAGAVLSMLRGRLLVAAGLIGLSVAIKLVTLVVVPWLLIQRLRAGDPWRPRVLGALAILTAALAPTLMLLAVTWTPGALGSSLLAHWSAHSLPGTGLGALLARRWPLAPIFIGCCMWVYWRPGAPALQAAWAVFSTAFILLGLEIWYPWYFTWPLALALVRWDGMAVGFVIGANTLAMTMMSFYTRG